MVNKEENKYLAAMKHVFNTPRGIEVLKYWKAEFVDGTALVPGDSHASMYCMGKKELVQTFLDNVNQQYLLDEPIKIETESL